MTLELATLLPLILLGGLVAVDGTGCGQFMIARPFVASTLGGVVVGDPAAGAAIGLVLEAFHLTVLPVGAASYPDGGAPALTAGALFGSGAGGVAAVVTSVVFFLLWSWVAGETVRVMRRANSPIPSRGSLTPAELQLRHARALGVDFVRGMLLVATGTAVLSLMLLAAHASWGIGERAPQLVLEGAVAGLLASGLRLLGGKPAAFVMGAAGGLILLAMGA